MKDHASPQDRAADSWSRGTINSIPAPQELPRARMSINPVSVASLGPAVPPDYLCPGYLARGHVTLLTALWKSGKSTFASHLIRDLQNGGGLAGECKGVETLVLSEESSGIWANRRDALNLDASLHVCVRPCVGRPNLLEWTDGIAQVAEQVAQRGFGLVMIDTLPSMWPVVDENDAGQVGSALMPLHQITAQGAALLLIHHPRKGDASEAQASRGSGALPGFVDIIMEMRRFNAQSPTDRRRKITAYGRFDDIPPEQVFELTEGGYVSVGDVRSVEKSVRMEGIEDVLPKADPGLTSDEILSRLPSENRPGKRTLESLLAEGIGIRWVRSGAGVKGDPYRFTLS